MVGEDGLAGSAGEDLPGAVAKVEDRSLDERHHLHDQVHPVGLVRREAIALLLQQPLLDLVAQAADVGEFTESSGGNVAQVRFLPGALPADLQGFRERWRERL